MLGQGAQAAKKHHSWLVKHVKEKLVSATHSCCRVPPLGDILGFVPSM
jgi:hypothetical protein